MKNSAAPLSAMLHTGRVNSRYKKTFLQPPLFAFLTAESDVFFDTQTKKADELLVVSRSYITFAIPKGCKGSIGILIK